MTVPVPPGLAGERTSHLEFNNRPEPLVKFAYADPPYLGCGKRYADKHPEALVWDDAETHRALIARLVDDFPDGWAMSLSTPSLRTILPMCPEDCRVSAWVKPFAVFKPNVGVAYAWEPVIWRGGRRRTREQDTTRDWIAENITLKRGLTGAKPRAFARWIFDMLNVQRDDDFVDLFPGSNAIMEAWLDFSGSRQHDFALESTSPPKSFSLFKIP